MEDQTGIKDTEPRLIMTIILARKRCDYPEDAKYWPENQEEIENWVTFKQMKDRLEQLGMFMVFVADAAKEAQVRRKKAESG